MSKVNPSLKKTSKFEEERLAGGSGALAAKQSNVALLRRVPKPFGTYNYICDVSAHTKGVNYKGVWTAEISGFSEHFITFIAAMEGIQNTFEE